MARYLDVYLGADLVGQLEQDDHGALWFGYLDEWLTSERAFPLSVSLPLRGERFKRNECRPFFAGLLPEENSRRMVARTFGVSERNDFAILEKIGAECAGAVSLLPRGEKLILGEPSYREISVEELAEKLAAVPHHPLMAGDLGIRLSLAGAQGKIAVMIRDGRYFLPLDGSPSTHIIKPKSPFFEGLVENEYACMRLASEIGLDVAKVDIGVAGGVNFLQVERYDRRFNSVGNPQRIHQEDFCQALGIAPEMKYQQEGGPGFKQCFGLVREQSVAPGPDILKLFDAVIFNYLIGNSDAHGKNFSLLYGEAGCRLAPLYDLVCTQAYPDISSAMAMKVGGERESARIFKREWESFFNDIGLGKSAAARRMRLMAERVGNAAKLAANQLSFAGLISANCEIVSSLE